MMWGYLDFVSHFQYKGVIQWRKHDYFIVSIKKKFSIEKATVSWRLRKS